jgi:hypothetical protein
VISFSYISDRYFVLGGRAEDRPGRGGGMRIEQLEYVAVVARLDSFDRLRNAADEQHRSVRQVRLGLVNYLDGDDLPPDLENTRTTA